MKHPEASLMYNDLLITGTIALVNEVIYDSIDESEILQACLSVKCAARVFGLDAGEW